MEDKVIKCKDCGQNFVFTVGEQEFFADKGFALDHAEEHAPVGAVGR